MPPKEDIIFLYNGYHIVSPNKILLKGQYVLLPGAAQILAAYLHATYIQHGVGFRVSKNWGNP